MTIYVANVIIFYTQSGLTPPSPSRSTFCSRPSFRATSRRETECLLRRLVLKLLGRILLRLGTLENKVNLNIVWKIIPIPDTAEKSAYYFSGELKTCFSGVDEQKRKS